MKEKAIYAPGELKKVRDRLGDIDGGEAKRMTRILGGEIGIERFKDPPKPSGLLAKGAAKRAAVEADKVFPLRRVVTAEDAGGVEETKKSSPVAADPGDNPALPVRPAYRERIKLDRYAAKAGFEIKTFIQALVSVLSFINPPPDYLNPAFVAKRMNEYYKQIENLVLSTRSLFPRSSRHLTEQLRLASPFACEVLEIIRRWDIEQIASDLTHFQAHPRRVRVQDFAGILKHIYRPLFILELLDTETQITEVYKLLYRHISGSGDPSAHEKHLEKIQIALTALRFIRKDVRFLLYPLLMKLLSDRWLPYELFFSARRNRYLDLIGASEDDRILPADFTRPVKVLASEEEKKEENASKDAEKPGETQRKPITAMEERERKALGKGLQTMEILFPKAGWDRLSEYPDLYPYFREVFSLKKEYALISPSDPLFQIAVLARVLEEFIYGLRYAAFASYTSPDGTPGNAGDMLTPILNNWQYIVENSFEREYLPRLTEYCRVLENTAESSTSVYARRLLNELYWLRRLYFFPYYKFESAGPPPFSRQEITPLYVEIRKLRKVLTAVAAGIEQGFMAGGVEVKAHCDGIDNPWEYYEFQVPNPLSKRLDALLSGKKRNNAALIFFTLSTVVVLDNLINNEESWAYAGPVGPFFRSLNGEGVIPTPGVDVNVDAEELFKQSLKKV
jgi:hypothetical protein